MKFNLLQIIIFSLFSFNSGFNSCLENSIIINYSHSTHIEGLPSETVVNSSLVSNNVLSIYEMDYVGNSKLIDEEDGEEGGVFLSVRSKNNPKIFKNLKNKSIYSKERIGLKQFLVVDSEDIFSWTLTNGTKKILNYECQEAKLNYRGREYTAYFTTKIQFNLGPWKFGGLPGTILEIGSDDGVFKIKANRINIKNSSLKIINPFTNTEKAITWNDFISKYKKKYEELQSYTAPGGGTMSIPKRKIEVLIED